MAALADSNMSCVIKLDALEEAARTRNVELSIHRIASGAEIAAAIDMAHASGAAALNILASPMLYANRQLNPTRVLWRLFSDDFDHPRNDCKWDK
jgi:putative ABC transport system substrate-binding protein